jgi:hypothetical protein
MTKEPKTNSIRAVEKLVNAHRLAGLDDRHLALILLAAGADLLTRAWDAPRVLAAFDKIVEAVESVNSEATEH